MKNSKLVKMTITIGLSVVLAFSVSSCDEFWGTETQSTTTTFSTTATTTRETTVATTEYTSVSDDVIYGNPEIAQTADAFVDEEVRAYAQEAIDANMIIIPIDEEIGKELIAEGIEYTEGFYAATADNPAEVTFVIKFVDTDAVKRYIESVNEGIDEEYRATITENEDGSLTLDLGEDGTAVASANGVLKMVMNY